MIDFGALPPEINSGRMYTGPGAMPLLAAAAAWDELSSELGSTAAMYGLTVTELTGGPWVGPASMTMLGAAVPYVAWLTATAGQAELAATRAKAAAAAYEAAFAMTVPPPVIAANRAQLMLLIATNFFGQNTPAIAATEAHYAEMWAQDATAMYGYAGSSAAASTVTPFTRPPQTTNQGGLSGQAAAVSHAASTPSGSPTTVPSAPTNLTAATPTPSPSASTAPSSSALTTLNNGWSSGLSWTNGSAMHSLCAVWRYTIQTDEYPKALKAINEVSGVANAVGGPARAVAPALGPLPGPNVGAPVAATLGRATQVGALSVPGSFPGATPTLVSSTVTAELADGGGASKLPGGMPGMPGVPGARSAAGGHGLRFVPRYGYRNKVMVQPPGAG